MNLIRLIVEELMINFLEKKKYFIVVKGFYMAKNGFFENLFEYYFLNFIVNINFFSDLKFEYYCEYYLEILLQVSLK